MASNNNNNQNINPKPCSYGYIIQIYYNTQTVIRNVLLFLTNLNLPTKKKLHEEKKKNVDFAAILTGKEEVPEVDTLDTALATFQSKDDNNKKDLKYSVKVTDTDKIKEVRIDIGKPLEKPEVVAELYKSEIPSDQQVLGNLCEGNINSQELKGPLKGKNTKELINKIEKGEAYVDILTEDKPKGKVRGKIKKLAPSKP
jgi:CHRD domain